MHEGEAPAPASAALVDEAHRGFERFYEAEHGRLVASLVLATGDADLAQEAADEAFLRALMAWSRVQAMASPGGWTYRVAVNVARRRARRRAVERRLWARRAPAPSTPPPAGEAWTLVRDLPDRQRLAVVLRFIGDLTEPQIAEVMGISRSTVSSTLADANRRLAMLLDDDRAPERDAGGGHA